MFEFIITVILSLIFLISLYVIFKVYRKLTYYKNQLSIIYDELYILIEKKFELVSDNVLKKDSELISIVNRFKKLDSVDDVINISLELDRETLKYKRRVWYKEYKLLLEELNDIKFKYNENVLRFNNIIKMFPISIISNLFGFETWLYYRND